MTDAKAGEAMAALHAGMCGDCSGGALVSCDSEPWVSVRAIVSELAAARKENENRRKAAESNMAIRIETHEAMKARAEVAERKATENARSSAKWLDIADKMNEELVTLKRKLAEATILITRAMDLLDDDGSEWSSDATDFLSSNDNGPAGRGSGKGQSEARTPPVSPGETPAGPIAPPMPETIGANSGKPGAAANPGGVGHDGSHDDCEPCSQVPRERGVRPRGV